jgi:hypothetical protein
MSLQSDEDGENFLRSLRYVRPSDRMSRPVLRNRIQELREGASTDLLSYDNDPLPVRNRSLLGLDPHPLSRNQTFLDAGDPSYWPDDDMPQADTFAPSSSDLQEYLPWPDDLLSTHEVLRETFPEPVSFFDGENDWLMQQLLNADDTGGLPLLSPAPCPVPVPRPVPAPRPGPAPRVSTTRRPAHYASLVHPAPFINPHLIGSSVILDRTLFITLDDGNFVAFWINKYQKIFRETQSLITSLNLTSAEEKIMRKTELYMYHRDELQRRTALIQTWYYTLELLHKRKIIEITERDKDTWPVEFTILESQWSIASFNIFFVIFMKDPADRVLDALANQWVAHPGLEWALKNEGTPESQQYLTERYELSALGAACKYIVPFPDTFHKGMKYGRVPPRTDPGEICLLCPKEASHISTGNRPIPFISGHNPLHIADWNIRLRADQTAFPLQMIQFQTAIVDRPPRLPKSRRTVVELAENRLFVAVSDQVNYGAFWERVRNARHLKLIGLWEILMKKGITPQQKADEENYTRYIEMDSFKALSKRCVNCYF